MNQRTTGGTRVRADQHKPARIMAGRGILQVNGEAFKNLWSFEIRLLQVIGTVVVFYTG
jgi:hypothetical protein